MYELVDVLGSWVITRTDENGAIWCIPANLNNIDYQRYLVDTDGGLPTPKQTEGE